MRSSVPTLTVAVLLLLASGTPATSAQADAGRAHGVVADESGGVMPGVTATATSTGGQILATVVTDEAGRYAFRALPAAPVRLTFQLEGFSTTILDMAVATGVDSLVATQRLRVAPTSETVDVRGTPPRAVSIPAPRVAPLPPRPRPVLKPVPEHDRDSICGPAKPDANETSYGTIRSRRTAGNDLYGEGDEVIIDAGTAAPVEIGQNLVARRSYRTSSDLDGAAGEHTAGLLQIVASDEQAAVAVVVYACDEMMRGDWLAPFNPEPIRAPEPAGIPAYDRAARILLADAGQLVGAPRRLMVIDQGTDNGIRVGQRLTLFRPSRGHKAAPVIVGGAVVVAVRVDSATIRIQNATDVIVPGDSAAPQRP